MTVILNFFSLNQNPIGYGQIQTYLAEYGKSSIVLRYPEINCGVEEDRLCNQVMINSNLLTTEMKLLDSGYDFIINVTPPFLGAFYEQYFYCSQISLKAIVEYYATTPTVRRLNFYMPFNDNKSKLLFTNNYLENPRKIVRHLLIFLKNNFYTTPLFDIKSQDEVVTNLKLYMPFV